jgi:hypothetical protein
MAERRDDPDAPVTPEEAAASSRLRDALDAKDESDESVALARSLQAAWSPTALSTEDHDAILDDVPTAEELALAEELRDALDGGTAAPDLVRALKSAWNPGSIDAEENRAIVSRAIDTATTGGRNVVPFRAAPRRARVLRGVFLGATGALALAASVVVWMTSASSVHDREMPLARTRSTQPLFAEPFGQDGPGEASARIDRIALARASDYRDNRFAKWGVR